MNEYLYIIRGGENLGEEMSPEAMQEHMQKWGAWMGGLAEAGKLVGGQPLESPGKSLVDAGQTVIDRPLMEGKELVGGYLIMKAETLEEATDLAKGCPGFEHDCTIEVRQIKVMG
jgi:hypothetical protein